MREMREGFANIELKYSRKPVMSVGQALLTGTYSDLEEEQRMPGRGHYENKATVWDARGAGFYKWHLHSYFVHGFGCYQEGENGLS